VGGGTADLYWAMDGGIAEGVEVLPALYIFMYLHDTDGRKDKQIALVISLVTEVCWKMYQPSTTARVQTFITNLLFCQKRLGVNLSANLSYTFLASINMDNYRPVRSKSCVFISN